MRKKIQRVKKAEAGAKALAAENQRLKALLDNRKRAADGYKTDAMAAEAASAGAVILLRALMLEQETDVLRIGKGAIEKARGCYQRMVSRYDEAGSIEIWAERPLGGAETGFCEKSEKLPAEEDKTPYEGVQEGGQNA